jgi:hypothetical protein
MYAGGDSMSDQDLVKQQFILYSSDTGDVKLHVVLENETIWLTQKMMAELFEVEVNTVNYHLKEIFESGELDEKSVIRKIRITAVDGKSYLTQFYNLDVIIAVGYRVNSKRATQFRIWATKTLREYIIKGFVVDDERLKQGERLFKKDYFRELLERVRSIRASERRIYQQITDIFAEISVDYDPHSETTRLFFALVQNKFHFAITGQTAAELVYERADHTKQNMGLATWKNSPSGRILQSDATVAKNYLTEEQIKKLERTVSSFFDYLENLIENEKMLTMEDMARAVDAFLNFNRYQVLDGAGTISATRAKNKALREYEQFDKTQPIESDFDRELKKLLGGRKSNDSDSKITEKGSHK